MLRRKINDWFIPNNLKKMHNYWKNPFDKCNKSNQYLKGKEKSNLLLRYIKKYGSKEHSILELGCNCGRNLNILYKNGFKNLEGIEINKKSVQLMKEKFNMDIPIHISSIEDIIKNLDKYDIVFSMAVFEHIHPKSKWIFEDISRIVKKYLITIEDEKGKSWRQFPRNYKKVFKNLKQIEEFNCKDIKGLGKNFNLRVFHK
jgi:2-polyprenyl-3-methyl-5-hydroxy-6-metoxy-1,4-benzoquinol methylase